MKKNFLSFGILAVLLSVVSCSDKDDAASQRVHSAHSDEKTFTNFVSGSTETDRLQSRVPTDFAATGFYALPNTVLKIKVELVSGTQLPVLIIGTYSRYRDQNEGNAQEVKLNAGENIVENITYGGLLYIRMGGKSFSNKAKVNFISGHKKAPYYKLGETTETNWDEQLTTFADAPDVILESERTMMVMSRAHALEYRLEDQGEILKKADEIINWEDDISGLDGSLPVHERSVLKHLMTETDKEDPYMFATNYRTAYNFKDGCEFPFTKKLYSKDGWGPWHEIGHMHQQTWTWSGLGEVTVNIYSLMVQRKLGFPSRLKTEKNWEKNMDVYFAKTVRDFNTDSDLGPFGRLCMFQQLWLVYGDTYFHKLHKITREEKPAFADSDAKMRYWMLTTCKITGNDLTAFYKKWGLPAPAAVFDEIKSMNLPIPIVEPSTMRE
ncbi:hypothetical protein ASE21_15150 [Flavobacterium sp. Root901]|uniref:M60 family metallopeptidase n=1 Tax=Flavobacterium sp. Root901 TaxID=1736605 RepID=UPI00070917FA|nr:M60 family metallopeptidase [Flavobacterium sp. Root901]KRD09176.1 hypothetical protein ASE21_15150 [Flavobacterium sp. Root901]